MAENVSGIGITMSTSTETAGATVCRVGKVTEGMVTNIGRIRVSMVAVCVM